MLLGNNPEWCVAEGVEFGGDVVRRMKGAEISASGEFGRNVLGNDVLLVESGGKVWGDDLNAKLRMRVIAVMVALTQAEEMVSNK